MQQAFPNVPEFIQPDSGNLKLLFSSYGNMKKHAKVLE